MNRFSLPSTTLAAFLATAPGTSIAQPAAAKQPLSHEALFLMERVGSPAVSPDGKWVVFPVTVPAYEEKNETADLWIVPVDGSAKPRRLTSNKAAESGPAWSADSRKIAAERKEAKSKIRIYDSFPIRRWDRWLDDTQTHLFAVPATGEGAGDSLEPAWAPDGKSIVFVATTNRDRGAYSPTNTHLFEVAVTGGEPRPLTWPWNGSIRTLTPKLDRSVADFAIAPDSRTLSSSRAGEAP